MPNFQVFLLMTISNHVNFEKLLLRIFDTKYKSIEVGVGGLCTGNCQWNVCKQETDLSQRRCT